MATVRRDGFNESIWQSGIAAYHSGQQHSVDLYDVILAGGGITGITTAYELQKGGQHCLILEAQNLCFGTTAGTTAHINNFFDKSYDEVEKGFNKKTAMVLAAAANNALALVKQHIEDLDIDCDYRESPGVLYALDKKQAGQLEKLYEASRRAGIDVEPVNEIPVPVPFKKAIR
ncbi:MAG TPA: FAD-dependent oxidoreductase, partial [Puia sp.]